MHLFAVNSQQELDQLVKILAWYRRQQFAQLNPDVAVIFNCWIKHDQQIYAECRAQATSRYTETVFIQYQLEYFPPRVKPDWFYGKDIQTSSLHSIPATFDEVVHSFTSDRNMID